MFSLPNLESTVSVLSSMITPAVMILATSSLILTTTNRLVRIERILGEWSKGRKLYGNLFDDLLKLKYLHQRYTNYLHWLTFKG